MLDSFHLLLALILPRPHIIVRLPVLEALQHGLILVEDPIDFLITDADVQTVDTSRASQVALLSLVEERLRTFRSLFFIRCSARRAS